MVKGNSRISPSSVGIRQGAVGKERSPIRVKGTMLESYRIPLRRRTRSAHIVWGRMDHSGARYPMTRPPPADDIASNERSTSSANSSSDISNTLR